ncbi:unnamed protein product [Linum tenue]|uniref:Peptidoglycan binding-like domain-containing protein n=1 Tax=Linum tenue TaxID=586396 RepID=A0AAV0LQG3_9ROSI|nr:unnamed protein product [Linum tenue]
MGSPMSSYFLILLNPPLSIIQRHKPPNALPLLALYSKSSLLHKTHVCHARSSISSSSGSDREELLWLREEQRWLREEQRWLREEQRWLRERESLLSEIQSLKLQIQVLEKRITVAGDDAVPANVGALLQVLKERSLILESASSATPIELVETVEEEAEAARVMEVKNEETAAVGSARVVEVENEETKLRRKKKALRAGSEGEEVREMQEALQKLGFYSGEEDMEFSSFSSGTELAVKTWQATLGAPEDGNMSAELLERLYLETRTDLPLKGDINGAAVAPMTELSKIHQKVVKEEGATSVEASHHRVFLLGENRWEEPSRLVSRYKEDTANWGTRTTQCRACRGTGRVMCTECDGTGEPNIEPQFLEWIGEDTKCAYCDGGFITCDVCDGKAVS